jgi:tetratricopeptide (TPR) repeat protein
MRYLLMFVVSILCSFAFAQEKPSEHTTPPPQPEQWWLTDSKNAKQTASDAGRLLLVLFYKEGSYLCERALAALDKTKLGNTATRLIALKFGELDDINLRFKWMLHTMPTVVLVDPKSETVLARLDDPEKMGTADEWVKNVLSTETEMNSLKGKLKEKSDDAESLLRLAEIELLRGLNEDAQTHFERVTKVDEENKQGLALKAAVKLLSIYFDKGNQQNVVTMADNIKKWDKENKNGYCDDADFAVAKSIQFLTKMPEVALRRWEEFLKNYPQSELRAEALLYLGLIKFGRGERDKAKLHWEEAISSAPENGAVALKAKAYIANMDIPIPEKKQEKPTEQPKKEAEKEEPRDERNPPTEERK